MYCPDLFFFFTLHYTTAVPYFSRCALLSLPIYSTDIHTFDKHIWNPAPFQSVVTLASNIHKSKKTKQKKGDDDKI